MSANSSNKSFLKKIGGKWSRRWWLWAIGVPAWILVGFYAAQFIIVGVLYVVRDAGVSFEDLDDNVFNAVLAAAVYLLTLLIVIGVPWLVRRVRTTREDIGLTRLPSWMDIVLPLPGFVIYFFVAAILAYIASVTFPGFNADQVQETGFSQLTNNFEYILAFVTLIIVAPLAEEVLFRGYLYGWLRKKMPIWLAMLLTSALFGFLHGQWNVGINVFALSLVLCSLREVTGSIWAGILLHMLKNGLAFYLLFINPFVSHTIGG